MNTWKLFLYPENAMSLVMRGLLVAVLSLSAGMSCAAVTVSDISGGIPEAGGTATDTIVLEESDARIRSFRSVANSVIPTNHNGAFALSIEDATVSEGTDAGNVAMTVTLDHDVAGGFEVTATALADSATATDDYSTLNQTLTFAGTAGEQQTLTLDITNDDVAEETEMLVVSIAVTGNNSVVDTARVTIYDDDSALLIVEDTTVLESSIANVTVTLTNADVEGGFTVVIYTEAGSATAGEDYTETKYTLTFDGTHGGLGYSFNVDIKRDTVVDDGETFTVRLGAVAVLYSPSVAPRVGEAGLANSATVTIRDVTFELSEDQRVTLHMSTVGVLARGDAELVSGIIGKRLQGGDSSDSSMSMLGINLSGPSGSGSINGSSPSGSAEEKLARGSWNRTGNNGLAPDASNSQDATVRGIWNISSNPHNRDSKRFATRTAQHFSGDFNLALDGRGEAGGASFWGSAGGQDPTGTAVDAGGLTFNYTGYVRVVVLGYDKRTESGHRGIALGYSNGDLLYDQFDPTVNSRGTVNGFVEKTMISIYPYYNRNINENLDFWMMAGLGSGEHGITEAETHAHGEAVVWEGVGSVETTLASGLQRSYQSAKKTLDGAVRFKVLYSRVYLEAAIARVDAALIRDVYDELLPKITSTTTRVRLDGEFGYAFRFGSSAIRPYAVLSLRLDGGDAVGADSTNADAGLGVQVDVGMVRLDLAHYKQQTSSNTEESSTAIAVGSVNMDFRSSGAGFYATLQRKAGALGEDANWSLYRFEEQLQGNRLQTAKARASMESTLGYDWKGGWGFYTRTLTDDFGGSRGLGLKWSAERRNLTLDSAYRDATGKLETRLKYNFIY